MSNPSTDSYVRSTDHALMVPIAPWQFVSEHAATGVAVKAAAPRERRPSQTKSPTAMEA
jgi:hypothetical protein